MNNFRTIHLVPTAANGGVRRYVQQCCSGGRGEQALLIAIFEPEIKGSMPIQCEQLHLNHEKAEFQDRERIADRICSAVSEFGAQIVHSHHVGTDIYAALAKPAWGKSALIRHVHGVTQVNVSKNFNKEMVRQRWGEFEITESIKVDPLVDLTICVSHHIGNMVKRYSASEKRLCVLLNGVNIYEFFPPTFERRSLARKKFCVRHNEIVVGFLGGGDLVKNPELVVQVSDLLNSDERKWKFILMGSDPSDIRLTAPISRARFPECLVRCPFSLNVREFLEVVDIVLIPSQAEGFSFVAAEAMACGIPVVASAVGGLPEVVRHEEEGLLFSAGQVQGAVDALRRLECETYRRELGARGRHRAEATLNLDAHLRSLDEKYTQAFEARNVR